MRNYRKILAYARIPPPPPGTNRVALCDSDMCTPRRPPRPAASSHPPSRGAGAPGAPAAIDGLVGGAASSCVATRWEGGAPVELDLKPGEQTVEVDLQGAEVQQVHIDFGNQQVARRIEG